MFYGILADLVLAIHLGYVAYVVVGQLLILVGLALGWRWVRNWWFRVSHLAMIAIVAAESLLRIRCPLTDWEWHLRRWAGQTPSDVSFIGRLLASILFFECSWDEHVLEFTLAYVAFALIVVATFVFAPPRWRNVQSNP